MSSSWVYSASTVSMMVPLRFHGAYIVRSKCLHSVPVVSPRGCVSSKVGPWCFNGRCLRPWWAHGAPMVPTRCLGRDPVVGPSWWVYGASMALPRCVHSASMGKTC